MDFMEKYSKFEELNYEVCQVRKELDASVQSVLKAYLDFHPDFKDAEYIHFDGWNVVTGSSGWTSIIIFFDYRGSEYSQMFPIECFDSLEERDKFIKETINDVLKERELEDKIKQQEIVGEERKLLTELRAK